MFDYSSRYPLPEKPRQKRAVIQDMVRPLKQWLLRHRHNPYPTKAEKMELAVGSNMTLVQVSNWFANARRRLKNVVQDPKCSWSKRLRMYNQFVQGNAELLSISSSDSIWNSDSDSDDNDRKIFSKNAWFCYYLDFKPNTNITCWTLRACMLIYEIRLLNQINNNFKSNCTVSVVSQGSPLYFLRLMKYIHGVNGAFLQKKKY